MNSAILNLSIRYNLVSAGALRSLGRSLKQSRSLSHKINVHSLAMPSLSPTMTHGTISVWRKNEGDSLKAGDILCEIETDKASVGFEMQDEGVLAKRLVPALGAEMKVGEPIALLVDDEAAYKEFVATGGNIVPAVASVTSAAVGSVTVPATTKSSLAVPPSPSTNNNVRPSPAARHIAESNRVDLSAIVGTGKGGRISKSDVLHALKGTPVVVTALNTTSSAHIPTSAPSPVVDPILISPDATILPFQGSVVDISTPVNQRFKDIPNNNMRKVIAKRLTESKATVPHTYTMMEIEIDSVLSLRKNLKKDLDVSVSVNDVVIKCAALALRDMPDVNAKWNPKTNSIEDSKAVDISVAVATPNGLITPIVTRADSRGLVNISETVKDLAGRARDGKLKPEEFQGGSFSISNLGMFGTGSFTAVINPPQACILAVGAGVSRVLPPKTADASPRVATVVTVQLSADRRVVSEALAGEFLQTFKKYLATPANQLL